MSTSLMAIDTSGDACSAALWHDGHCLQLLEIAPRRHSELIFSMLDKLLKQANLKPQQLDALAFSRGPGSFTGVRIATAVVQGIGFAADLPVVPISTLAALAHQAWRLHGNTHVLPALDARMHEIYFGAYQCSDLGKAIACSPEVVSPPQAVNISSTDDTAWFGIGSGWQSYAPELTSALAVTISGYDATAQCQAEDIALLAINAFHDGQAVSADQALPVYIRDQVTFQPS